MLTLYTLICLHTKQIPSWHEERHMFKKERAICPSIIWIYTGKSHLLSRIKSLEPLCFWRKPVTYCLPNKHSNKHSSSRGPYCILVCVHDYSISKHSFTNHTRPSLWTGMWLCPPESPATTHEVLEKFTQITCFFSSPFTNFVPEVPGLKSTIWRHLKLPRINTWPKHCWRSAVSC